MTRDRDRAASSGHRPATRDKTYHLTYVFIPRERVDGVMKTVSYSRFVDAPRDDVWAFVSEPEHRIEFTDVERIERLGSDEMGLGTSFRQWSSIGPMDAVTDWTVTEWDPGTRFTHETAKYGGTLSFTTSLVDEGDGTRVTIAATVDSFEGIRLLGRGFDAAFAPLLGIVGKEYLTGLADALGDSDVVVEGVAVVLDEDVEADAVPEQ